MLEVCFCSHGFHRNADRRRLLSKFTEYVVLFHACPNNQHGPESTPSLRGSSLLAAQDELTAQGDLSLELASRPVHWDLMLEPARCPEGERLPLITFATTTEPGSWLTSLRRVLRLPDHRAIYLDYEGPISNDRGSVERVDKGSLEWILISDSKLEWIARSYEPPTRILPRSGSRDGLDAGRELRSKPLFESVRFTAVRIDGGPVWELSIGNGRDSGK